MTKSKHTKRALFMSALSMLMCMAMLVGSTFAWFTDSVTSGKNKIVAGNLAVELEYSLDGENWAAVDENTNMFKEGALWEPGYTEVVYLKVVNAGSLALKYRFGINVADKVIGETAGGEAIDLADFIKFGVVEAESVFTDRADARDAVEATASLISAGYASSEGHLTKGSSSAMLALVVYMPEEVGNAANYGAGKTQPEIYMGINVHATQDTVERDSFDEKYDENAEYPEIKVSSASDLRTALKGENVKVVLENDIQIDDQKPFEIEANQTVEIDLAGHSIIAPDITDVNIITVYNKGGNLTLKNGSIINQDADATGYNKDAPYRNAALESYGGTLTVENCTIGNHAGNSGSYAVKVANDKAGNGCVATFTNTHIYSTRGGLNPCGNAQVTYNGGSIKADYYYPVFQADNAVAELNDTEIVKNGNGGNFVMYVAIAEEETGLINFNNCNIKSTVSTIKMAVTWGDGLNRIVFNDCTIENITNNVPVPTVDEGNEEDPFA